MGKPQKSSGEAQTDAGYDCDKVDDAVLALLYLTTWLERGIGNEKFARAWKGHDWNAMNRLFEKGMIHNPRGKAKSVELTQEGLRASERLFREMFCQST